jgi:hypothetical protein
VQSPHTQGCRFAAEALLAGYSAASSKVAQALQLSKTFNRSTQLKYLVVVALISDAHEHEAASPVL